MRPPLALSLVLLASACGESSVEPVTDAPTVNEVQPNATETAVDPSAPLNATEMPPFAEVPGAHPTAPEPAPIPAKFRGTWADSKSACADLKHPSRLGISGRTLRFPTFVIFGDSFSFPEPNQFALEGKIGGTDRPAEAHYSINAAGDVLRDEAGGGTVRVRCG